MLDDEDHIEPLDPPPTTPQWRPFVGLASDRRWPLPVVRRRSPFLRRFACPRFGDQRGGRARFLLLMAIDAGRLGRVDLEGKRVESAVFLFVGMLLLWVVVYPCAFFRRDSEGRTSALAAILVALFFAGILSSSDAGSRRACRIATAGKPCNSCRSSRAARSLGQGAFIRWPPRARLRPRGGPPRRSMRRSHRRRRGHRPRYFGLGIAKRNVSGAFRRRSRRSCLPCESASRAVAGAGDSQHAGRGQGQARSRRG